MKRRVPIFWLIPARDAKELLADIIGILSGQLKAPAFEPHLTLFAARTSTQSAVSALHQIDFTPVRLNVHHVAFSAKFTKTLFVCFEPNQALRKLLAALARATDSRETSLRDPHVSLLYKKLPASVKKELASTIRLPFRKVTFDLLKVVSCKSPTQTASDVRGWRPLAAKRLSR